jgi:hypothetical protein
MGFNSGFKGLNKNCERAEELLSIAGTTMAAERVVKGTH